MKFILAVHGSPHGSESGEHALNFAQAALAQGHTVTRVFFYHDGALQALNLGITPRRNQLTDSMAVVS